MIMWTEKLTNYDLRITIDGFSVGFAFVNRNSKILNPSRHE